jgi:hypothetical protein
MIADRIEITDKMPPYSRIPMFLNCSTCFERHTAHHQELKNCNYSLSFYTRLWLPVAVMAEWELHGRFLLVISI